MLEVSQKHVQVRLLDMASVADLVLAFCRIGAALCVQRVNYLLTLQSA
jgi:hypothetical protein